MDFCCGEVKAGFLQCGVFYFSYGFVSVAAAEYFVKFLRKKFAAVSRLQLVSGRAHFAQNGIDKACNIFVELFFDDIDIAVDESIVGRVQI